MTDLDELRRIAYGRTTGPADEEAAATARVALADHAAEQLRAAAELRASELREAEQQEAEQRAHTEQPHPEQPDHEQPVPADEPGRLRRLVASWRVWAVPACAAFLVGIALTAASAHLYSATTADDTTARTAPDYPLVDPTAEGTLAIPSGPVVAGDLAAAEQTLARPQSQGDALESVDSMIDAGSVRLITSSGFVSVYAARSFDARLCLVAIDTTKRMFDETSSAATTIQTCVAPDVFAAQGIEIDASDPADRRMTLHWDGSEVTTTEPVTAE